MERERGEGVSGVKGADGVEHSAESGRGANQGGSKPRVSFRDKVLGGGVHQRSEVLEGDLLQKKLAKIELFEGVRERPMIRFEEPVLEALARPWKEALAVKLLGKHISFTALRERLRGVWRLHGGYELMEVGNGFFMVKFDLPADRDLVINGGPWMIHDHYLAVKQWTTSFNPADSCFGQTMVWIRLSALNLMYYEESAIRTIAAGVGRPIKVDFVTKTLDRGKFARVCVEVDLAKPVIDQVWITDHWHKVEFECLHLICAKCKCFGHVERDCGALGDNHQVEKTATEAPDHGGRQPPETKFEFQAKSVSEISASDLVSDPLQDIDAGKNLGEHINEEGWTKVERKQKVNKAKVNLRVGPVQNKFGKDASAKHVKNSNKGKGVHVGPKINVNVHGLSSTVDSRQEETQAVYPPSKIVSSAVKVGDVIKGGRIMKTTQVKLIAKGSSKSPPRKKRARVASSSPLGLEAKSQAAPTQNVIILQEKNKNGEVGTSEANVASIQNVMCVGSVHGGEGQVVVPT